MYGQAPRYLNDQFTTRIAVTRCMTQSCQLLNIPLYISGVLDRENFTTVHIWNNLHNTLKAAKSTSTFKFYLKN